VYHIALAVHMLCSRHHKVDQCCVALHSAVCGVLDCDLHCRCRLFGFVARKSGSATDNSCHLFAEMDPSQPATAIVSFVEKLLVKHGHCLK